MHYGCMWMEKWNSVFCSNYILVRFCAGVCSHIYHCFATLPSNQSKTKEKFHLVHEVTVVNCNLRDCELNCSRHFPDSDALNSILEYSFVELPTRWELCYFFKGCVSYLHVIMSCILIKMHSLFLLCLLLEQLYNSVLWILCFCFMLSF